MSGTNKMTLDSYEQHVADYVSNTNQETSDAFKAEITKSLDGMKRSARIFEVGSGPGKEAKFIESLGYKVQRSDAARAFVGLMEQEGYVATVFNALADEFPASYDVIFANAVVLHFTREEAAGFFRKVYATLNAGGRFIFSVKQGEGEEVTDRKLGAQRYFCYWNEDGLEEALASAGFQDIRVEEVDDYRPSKPKWLFVTAIKVKSQS